MNTDRDTAFVRIDIAMLQHRASSDPRADETGYEIVANRDRQAMPSLRWF